ncbi:MAG: hypothetical protein ACR2PG_04155 [Hyphomicrobiaceae bacterium]
MKTMLLADPDPDPDPYIVLVFGAAVLASLTAVIEVIIFVIFTAREKS